MDPTLGRQKAVYLLAESPFPPVSGGGRRASNIAAALGEMFDLTVVSADGRNEAIRGWDEASARFLARRRSRIGLAVDATDGILGGQHVLLVRSVRAGLPDVFRSWLRTIQPELVVLGRPMLMPYIQAAHDVGARVVVDADESLPNVAWSVARSPHSSRRVRIRATIEAIAVLGRMERRAYPRAAQVWVSSEAEKQSLSGFVDAQRIHVVPNAVPIPHDRPSAPDVEAVCFLGWYRYPPNEAAALELMRSIMPAVRLSGGPRQLVLIGPHPTPAMVREAASSGEVTITGQVVDVVAALRASGVLVVPLRSGGGTRVKILEAAAAGVPVVATALGIKGLGMTPGRHVLVAEGPAEFASQIQLLASDEGRRAALARAAFDFVRDTYSLDSVRSSIAVALGRLGSGT